VIAILADQHLGQQARCCQALGDRPFRCRCLMDAPASPAAVLRTADADDAQPRRHPVQHLAHRLADRMQGAAATRTGRHLEVEAHIVAFQMLGQARPIGSISAGRLLVSLHRRQQFLSPADVCSQILQPQLELIAIEPLGPPAELQALKLLHDQPQAFDLSLCCGERLAFAGPFRGQLPDQLMQGINVLRQSSKIELHEHTVRSVLRCRTAFDDPESIGRMTIQLQTAATVVRVSASRCPRSTSTAGPRSASPSRWPHLRPARRSGSVRAAW
jgi:hypothetical protein